MKRGFFKAVAEFPSFRLLVNGTGVFKSGGEVACVLDGEEEAIVELGEEVLFVGVDTFLFSEIELDGELDLK